MRILARYDRALLIREDSHARVAPHQIGIRALERPAVVVLGSGNADATRLSAESALLAGDPIERPVRAAVAWLSRLYRQ